MSEEQEELWEQKGGGRVEKVHKEHLHPCKVVGGKAGGVFPGLSPPSVRLAVRVSITIMIIVDKFHILGQDIDIYSPNHLSLIIVLVQSAGINQAAARQQHIHQVLAINQGLVSAPATFNVQKGKLSNI